MEANHGVPQAWGWRWTKGPEDGVYDVDGRERERQKAIGTSFTRTWAKALVTFPYASFIVFLIVDNRKQANLNLLNLFYVLFFHSSFIHVPHTFCIDLESREKFRIVQQAEMFVQIKICKFAPNISRRYCIGL